MAIILKNAPKTEEGRKLNFSKEEEEKYRIIFRYDAEPNDWRHLICDYVRKVTERPNLQEEEVFRYVMAI